MFRRSLRGARPRGVLRGSGPLPWRICESMSSLFFLFKGDRNDGSREVFSKLWPFVIEVAFPKSVRGVSTYAIARFWLGRFKQLMTWQCSKQEKQEKQVNVFLKKSVC